MRDAFINTLTDLAAADYRIILITIDLGFGVFENFAKRFPKQFLNIGIAEQNAIGVATGLALEGYTVFVYSLANFPTLRCLEQIRNDACYHEANVKIVCMGGGFSYGALGISHHATEDLSILRALPNMTVVAPGDNWETAEATKLIASTPGTCYLRIDKSTAGLTNRRDEVFRLGKSRQITDGKDVTLITTGGILATVMKAAEILETQSIHCRILSMHTIVPLDVTALMDAAQHTRLVVTIEENTINGGLGSAVAEFYMENGTRPEIFHRIGLKNKFSSIVGDQEYLRVQYELDAVSIAKKVTSLIEI
jgi:transketolase